MLGSNPSAESGTKPDVRGEQSPSNTLGSRRFRPEVGIRTKAINPPFVSLVLHETPDLPHPSMRSA